MGFILRPGIFVVPNHPKKVDSRNKLDVEEAIQLYRNPRFEFIRPTKEAIKSLKAAKIPVKELSEMVLRAKSEDELDILKELNNSKPYQGVIETKRKSFHID